MEIQRCGIHAFHEVLGIDVDDIRFFWTLHSEDEHAKQTAYRITLCLNPEGTDFFWDTGKVERNEQRNIVCKPAKGFKSASFHYWRVTVWDQDGRTTTSSPNEFFTSYPRSSQLLPPYSMNQTYMPHTSLIFRTWFEDEPNRWKAVWIGNGTDKPLYLRKSIYLPRNPTRAIVFASGLGHFNLSCNGTPASPHVLNPGWTNYHRTVQFVSYDLSNKLTAGENVIGAHVGNGFYAGDQGDRFFWPSYEDNTYVRYGNELCFFAELHLFYDDGTQETIISGTDWKVRASATSLANIYASENHDKREYPVGWDNVSFDDSTWVDAKPLTGPRGKLKYQSQPPVTLHETVHPVSQKEIEPGTVAFDLGQNMSTMVRISVSGPAGAEVLIRYSETIDENGRVFMPDPLFKEFEYGVYSKIILSGTGMELWEPDFSFTCARYIQIEGVSLEPDQNLPIIHSVVGQHVSSAAHRLGSMKTDKDDVNALIQMCYWSFASNLFSYHTDCPQIEKFGWLEVTHLLFPATQYIRDMESLYSKILDDIIDTQEPNGLVPTMAPEIRYMCGPLHDTITWGGAVALLPELLKRYYGSTYTFGKIYATCTRYMDYLYTKERKGGLIEHGLGDWGRDIAFGNHQANIETAIYYKCLRNVELMARELGYASDAERYRLWAERIYTAYNDNLLVTSKTSHPYAFYSSLDNPGTSDRTMIAQAMALQYDLVPPEHKEDVTRAFLEDCQDCRIRAGEIGLKYLWNTLADVDRPDIVLAMARQEEHPSYMRFIKRGETTLLEFWQDACRSKSHDMLGTIYEWCYEAVLGLRSEEDGYRRWTASPPPSTTQVYPYNSAGIGSDILHLVDLFFRFIHNQPHSLFHEPSFKASVVAGTVSQTVLLSVLSSSARFAESPELRHRGEHYVVKAKKALKDDLEHICIENVQACVLIGNACMADCDADSESLYFAIANRMAQILNLGVTRAEDDGVTKEVKLRLWWTCFIVDTWSSAGSNLSRQFRHKRKRQRVPMDERMFFNMRPGDPDVTELEWRPGIWGYMVQLVEIYVKIQNLHMYLGETTEWDEGEIENDVQALDYELGVFEQGLPPGLRWSLENLRDHIRRDLGSVYVAFHIGLQHYYTLLFYLYLDRRRPPTNNGKAYADRCKYHATLVCDILKASREHEGAAVLYNIIGHVTVVSSSVLLYTYIFGDADELPDAKVRLESNLQSLVQLRRYWASIELMIHRLVIFQNNCINSATNNPHRYDKWMVKFLLAHALALEEKTSDILPPWPDPQAMEANPVGRVHLERSRVTTGIIINLQNKT